MQYYKISALLLLLWVSVNSVFFFWMVYCDYSIDYNKLLFLRVLFLFLSSNALVIF